MGQRDCLWQFQACVSRRWLAEEIVAVGGGFGWSRSIFDDRHSHAWGTRTGVTGYLNIHWNPTRYSLRVSTFVTWGETGWRARRRFWKARGGSRGWKGGKVGLQDRGEVHCYCLNASLPVNNPPLSLAGTMTPLMAVCKSATSFRAAIPFYIFSSSKEHNPDTRLQQRLYYFESIDPSLEQLLLRTS